MEAILNSLKAGLPSLFQILMALDSGRTIAQAEYSIISSSLTLSLYDSCLLFLRESTDMP